MKGRYETTPPPLQKALLYGVSKVCQAVEYIKGSDGNITHFLVLIFFLKKYRWSLDIVFLLQKHIRTKRGRYNVHTMKSYKSHMVQKRNRLQLESILTNDKKVAAGKQNSKNDDYLITI